MFSAQHSVLAEDIGSSESATQLPQPIVQVVSSEAVDYPATIVRTNDGINTKPWGTEGYETIGNSTDYLGADVAVTQELKTDNGLTWVHIFLNRSDLGWITKDALIVRSYVQTLTTVEVDYPANIKGLSDGINTLPWGTKGYQTVGSGVDYLGIDVIVTKEQLTDNGVTWANLSVNGIDLGWIAKNALAIREYAQITSSKMVIYSASIKRATDGINTQPWGTKGYRTIAYSSDYMNTDVTVSEERTTDSGVVWALVALDGEVLGWIAKDALEIYASVLTSEPVDYPAILAQEGHGINTAPWGTPGYRTIGFSDDHLGERVTVSLEKTLDNGVTWALLSINGSELGWVAKSALKVENYSQIMSSQAVDYPAFIIRGTDGINTYPWGTKGSKTIGYSYDYLDAEVTVQQEQVTDSGVTWAQIFLNGSELGWITKDALDVQEYVKVLSTVNVSYTATIISATDGINTKPWGTKGNLTIGYSNQYQWKEVTVSQEKLTNNGVLWALISINGREIGWVTKEAFYSHVVATTRSNFRATISRTNDEINTLPWGVKGFQTIATSTDYMWEELAVTQEKTTDTGVTFALISLDGIQLGWIAKAALAPAFSSNVSLVTNFVNSIAPVAYNLSSSNGLYTSVMIAQAALESSWGRSTLAMAPNYNLFGIKGEYNGESVMIATKEYVASTGTWITTNAQFQKYPSYLESLQANALKLASGVYWDAEYYKGTWRINTTSYKDSTAWLTGRYATDPNYNSKLNSIIETYSLWLYDVYD